LRPSITGGTPHPDHGLSISSEQWDAILPVMIATLGYNRAEFEDGHDAPLGTVRDRNDGERLVEALHTTEPFQRHQLFFAIQEVQRPENNSVRFFGPEGEVETPE
jgi:hypothetical protein